MISVYNSANLFIAPARGDRVRCEHSLLIPRDKLSFSSLLKFEQWHAGQRNCPLHSHITPFTPVEETRSPERRPIDRRSRDQLHLHFDQAIPAVVPHFCAGLSLYENFPSMVFLAHLALRYIYCFIFSPSFHFRISLIYRGPLERIKIRRKEGCAQKLRRECGCTSGKGGLIAAGFELLTFNAQLVSSSRV